MKTKKKILKLFLFAGLIGAATVAFTPMLNENYNSLSIANAEALDDIPELGDLKDHCFEGTGYCHVKPHSFWGLKNKED